MVAIQLDDIMSVVNKVKNIVIAGYGSAGMGVSALISKELMNTQDYRIIVIEPSDAHFYQPLWTLVGSGLNKFEESIRHNVHLIPKSASWLQDKIIEFKPTENCLVTSSGRRIDYHYLIVALGLELNYGRIPGMIECLHNKTACSNYSHKYLGNTRNAVDSLKDDQTFLFTYPTGPVKCPGAPQKIMYIIDSLMRKKNVRNSSQVIYHTPQSKIFGVPKYAQALMNVCQQKGIQLNFQSELESLDPIKRIANFKDTKNETKNVKFDFIHVVPHMNASKILEPLANGNIDNLVDVNPSTLRHNKFPNIFALGDCTNTPNSKTAAAVVVQSSIVTKNLVSLLKNQTPQALYDGYGSCPLITSLDKCILAEFDYTLTPTETFPFDQSIPRKSMFYLKKHILPHIYWNLYSKGLWTGPQKFSFFMKKFSLSD